MEVKRVRTGLGDIQYTKYEVVGCKHVRITSPYGYGSGSSSWTIRIPDLSSPSNYGGFATVAIYFARTLNEVKEVLSRFSTEEELFGAYYKCRLEGKFHLS